MELIQGVGLCTGMIIPCCVMSANVRWSSSRSGTGTRLGACCTGVVLSSSLMWYWPSRRPTPSLNTVGFCCMICWVESGPDSPTDYIGAPLVSGLFNLSLSR